jgi:hypothetical protein
LNAERSEAIERHEVPLEFLIAEGVWTLNVAKYQSTNQINLFNQINPLQTVNCPLPTVD